MKIVISWSFRYRDNSLVVMMCATGKSSKGKYVPIMISSLVVVFAVSELIILPGILTTYWSNEPIEGSLRKFFFMLTFTSIGIVTDFRQLAKEGLGRLAAAYGTILTFIIIPLGFFLAWLFHHGMVPPTAP